jgi:hypothetical protein
MSAPANLAEALADGWSDEDVFGSAELDSERERLEREAAEVER